MPSASETALLIINCGSSSIKFALYRPDQSLPLLFRGKIADIGKSNEFEVAGGDATVVHKQNIIAADHEMALGVLLHWLAKEVPSLALVAVGHRIVHGGVRFHEPVHIDTEVVSYLESLVPLAPNHQPASLQGIAALQRLRPGVLQVACFDTAFHHDRPEVEQHFALPDRPELELVRRYGFHGLSYEYIAQVLPRHLGEHAEGKVVVAHLGHGASLCALHQRRSIATTMTFTSLDGISMGTRCGSLDPAVVLYLLQQGMDAKSIADLLYFQSGLLGVSGLSDDMAVLLEQPTSQSRLAVEHFIHDTVRAIGSLAAALQGLDALVFTAGIGEHAAPIREAICQRCNWLGVDLNQEANRQGQPCISNMGSGVQVWVIPTDEELMIANHTLRLMNK